jgi:hypothetical protein
MALTSRRQSSVCHSLQTIRKIYETVSRITRRRCSAHMRRAQRPAARPAASDSGLSAASGPPAAPPPHPGSEPRASRGLSAALLSAMLLAPSPPTLSPPYIAGKNFSFQPQFSKKNRARRARATKRKGWRKRGRRLFWTQKTTTIRKIALP